jgi:hypothetical protein
LKSGKQPEENMMGRTCTRGKHEPAANWVRNQGLEFGRCSRCGRDLIRSRHQWRGVPQGFRVVWRKSAPGGATLNDVQLLLDLPPVGRALALRERRRERNGLLVALELAMLGIRGLAGALALRARLWAMAAPRRRAAPVLQLRAG